MNPIELLTLLLKAPSETDQYVILDKCGFTINQVFLKEWKRSAQQRAYSGDKQQALSIADVILLVGRRFDDDAVCAFSNWVRANVYTIVGEGRDAWRHYQAAGRHYRFLEDWLSLARMNVGAVAALYHVGEYEQGRQTAEEIIPILTVSDDLDDRKRLAGVFNNLAIIYDRQGRYEDSLKLYEQKISAWENWLDDPRSLAEIARTRINEGIIKKRLNLWAEAEMALEAGCCVLAKPPWQDTYQLDLVRGGRHWAILLAQRDIPLDTMPDAVLAAVAKSYADLVSSSENLVDLLYLDLLEIESQLRTEYTVSDWLDRLTVLREQCATSGLARELMQADLLLAEHHARQGNVLEAITRCTAVREMAKVHGEWEIVYRAWHQMGQVYVMMGDIKLAVSAFQSAVAVIEGTGRGVASGDLRSGFLEDKLLVYQDLVALYLDQGNLDGALHWAERTRARELVEMLADKDVPLPIQPQSQLLLEQLAQTRSELTTATEYQHRRALEMRITDISRRIAVLEPCKRDWLTGETAASSDLCAALPDGTLLLVYVVVRNNLWVFPLAQDGILSPVYLGIVPAAEVLERESINLHNLTQIPTQVIERHAEGLIASARHPLANWFDQFLAPLSDLLAQHQRLIIVPDGPLFRLPFHAFYNSVSDHYLIQTHQISYAPSATAWLLSGQREMHGQGGVVLAYDGEQLHHTESEMRTILKAHPDFVAYIGSDATPERLQETLTRQANFIHLAAHAVFRADHPRFSYIRLSDNRLETLDVMRLRLNATLVALSACETGRGLLRGGEYLGLARAFLLAGARSVLATHWAVDDAETARLMGTFYRHLAVGDQPSEALRKAQLAAISTNKPQYRHPYYWAPFFVFGAETPQAPK